MNLIRLTSETYNKLQFEGKVWMEISAIESGEFWIPTDNFLDMVRAVLEDTEGPPPSPFSLSDSFNVY